MLVALNALQTELGAPLTREQAVTLLPMLGFPIDGAEAKAGTTVLDVDITANRGDMMSHRGVARELAAKLGATLVPLVHAPLPTGAPTREIRLDTEACHLYATALLTLGEGATPESAKAFLALLGASAKGLPAVDASNELLHRYGHPTHAFDADTLTGAITVRRARGGERLVTLDGVERTLTAEDLVIADDRGPVALAGVMGGEATKVTAATRRVLLESASFDPRTVRLMARRHGLHTDASARFGRGADPAMAAIARDLLAARLQAWCGASLEAAWTVGALPAAPAPIAVDVTMVARMGGQPLPAAEIAALLQRLGCAAEVHGDQILAVPPSWRHDLTIPEDLAEEVLRLRGYDRLPEALPPVQSEPEPLSADYRKRQHLARRLAHLGFFQTVTYGFISPDQDAAFAEAPEGRTLGNPLGAEYSVLRGSLLPSLAAAARHNLRNGARAVRLFELAPVYAASEAGPSGTHRLAFVWGGTLGGEDPRTPARVLDPLDGLAVAQDLKLDPAHQAPVHILGDGLFGLEIPLEALPDEPDRVIPPFRPFSRFPLTTRDLSLLMPADLQWARVEAAFRQAFRQGQGTEQLTDLRCVDEYRGKGVAAGEKALLVRFTFQASDRTLTAAEVDAWVAGAREVVEAQRFGICLRG
ncbi:MAG TPA: phenylalanine--tRNA ligase subunit beta [Holophagaceae bacterium]|nr:phenylalanine--tRNA ligase subunit beta [Holophagaceae bacterium]